MRRNQSRSCAFCGNPVVIAGSKQARMVDHLRDNGWVTALELAAAAETTYESARTLLSRVRWGLERRRRLASNGSYEYRWVGE